MSVNWPFICNKKSLGHLQKSSNCGTFVKKFDYKIRLQKSKKEGRRFWRSFPRLFSGGANNKSEFKEMFYEYLDIKCNDLD